MTLSRPDDEGLAAIPADEFTALLEHENALAWHQETEMMRKARTACRDNDRYPYTAVHRGAARRPAGHSVIFGGLRRGSSRRGCSESQAVNGVSRPAGRPLNGDGGAIRARQGAGG